MSEHSEHSLFIERDHFDGTEFSTWVSSGVILATLAPSLAAFDQTFRLSVLLTVIGIVMTIWATFAFYSDLVHVRPYRMVLFAIIIFLLVIYVFILGDTFLDLVKNQRL